METGLANKNIMLKKRAELQKMNDDEYKFN